MRMLEFASILRGGLTVYLIMNYHPSLTFKISKVWLAIQSIQYLQNRLQCIEFQHTGSARQPKEINTECPLIKYSTMIKLSLPVYCKLIVMIVLRFDYVYTHLTCDNILVRPLLAAF